MKNGRKKMEISTNQKYYYNFFYFEGLEGLLPN